MRTFSFNNKELKFTNHDDEGLETVVSVLFSNTRTQLLYNEWEIFNTARSEAEYSIENFESSSLYSKQVHVFVNKTRTKNVQAF